MKRKIEILESHHDKNNIIFGLKRKGILKLVVLKIIEISICCGAILLMNIHFERVLIA